METRSTTECLQLAFKLRRFAVERGHPIPQVTTFADLSAEFFAHLFVALCGPYVDEIRVDPELKEDEILLVQSVIDALAVDLLSLSLPHLNAAAIVNRDPSSLYELLGIFESLRSALEERDRSIQSPMGQSSFDKSVLSTRQSSPMRNRLRELGQKHQNSPVVTYANRMKKFYGQFGKKSVIYSPRTACRRSYFAKKPETKRLVKRPNYDAFRSEYIERLGVGAGPTARVRRRQLEVALLKLQSAKLEKDLKQMGRSEEILGDLTDDSIVTSSDRRREAIELKALRAATHNAKVSQLQNLRSTEQFLADRQKEAVSEAIGLENLQERAKLKFLRELHERHQQATAATERYLLDMTKQEEIKVKQHLESLKQLKKDRVQMANERAMLD